jgi:hypothetical protein
VDPDPYLYTDWIRIQRGPWIRICIRIRNPDPYPDSQSGSVSRFVSGFAIWIWIQEGKKLLNFIFWCSLLRAEGSSCRLDILYGGLGIIKLLFFQLYWIRNWIQIRIRIHLKCWIRIRIRKIELDCDDILLLP